MSNIPSKSFDSAVEQISVLRKKKEHSLQQLNSFRFRWWGWPIAAIIGLAFTYSFLISTRLNSEDSITSQTKSVLGALAGLLIYAYVVGTYRYVISNKIRSIDVELIRAGAVELQENIDQNFFTKLVQINFKYIDQYYLQTHEQADKSFRLSAFAAISGLIIIVLGISMMYFGKAEPAYVTTAAGVLSEFIAAIFFYLYNRTILKMSQYHQKLVLTQNISLALKITDEMDKDQKDKALELLVDRLTADVNRYLTDDKD